MPSSLSEFFEELPSAVLAYSLSIGGFSLAAIFARVALRIWTGI